MSQKTCRISARITEEQRNKVDKSGLSDSEYVQNAIDHYDVSLKDTMNRMQNRVIDELIEMLNKQKKKVQHNVQQVHKESDVNVEQIVEQVYKENHEAVELFNIIQKEKSDKNKENVQQNAKEKAFQELGDDLQTIVNLLHIQGHLKSDQYKWIAAKTKKEPKEIRNFIDTYKTDLLNMPPKR